MLTTMKPLLHFSTRIAALFTVFAAGIAVAAEGAAPAPTSSLDDPTVFLKIILDAVEHKNWGVVAAAMLVMCIAAFRAFGKKIHEFIPDAHWADKPFFFLYDTKLGGWILNTVTAAAGGFGTALLAGATIDFELVRTVLGVSLSAAGIWGAVKDAMEHFGKAKPPDAGTYECEVSNQWGVVSVKAKVGVTK